MSTPNCVQEADAGVETIAQILAGIEGVRILETYGGGQGSRASILMDYGKSVEEMTAFTQRLAKAFGAYRDPSLDPLESARDMTRFLVEWTGDSRDPLILVEIRPDQLDEAATIFRSVLGREYGNGSK